LQKKIESVEEETKLINAIVDRCAEDWNNERFIKEFEEFKR
jgi:hypothetical protein